MKRIIITTGSAFALVLALITTVATAKVDFSGVWALDKSSSEGLPPDMDQTMIVVQTGDKLSLETKLITGKGEQTVADTYLLDGKEVEFTPKSPNGLSGKGKRTAKWTTDGNGIDVNEKVTFDTPEGSVTVQTTRKWTLSADGKTIKIELNTQDPNGMHQSKRTFNKK